MEEFSRTQSLIGERAVEKLKTCKVAVFGIGGVGGFVAEALARCGVGAIELVDKDEVSLSNINRQIVALHSTLGMKKTAVMQSRILDINPDCKVTARDTFFLPETADSFDFSSYDYVVDAIDTVSGKIALVEKCKQANTPVICAMGAGNKLDPTQFEVADISKTSVCPLARVMRKELKARGIEHVKVVYSKEQAHENAGKDENGKPIPASVSFVPPVMGFILAGEVLKELIK